MGDLGKHGGISQSFGWWGVSPPTPPIMENPATCTHIWFLMGQFCQWASGFDLCISVALKLWFNYTKFRTCVILNRYLSNTCKNVRGNFFMFSESLDLRKMLKEKTRFSIFSLEIKNKMKKFRHTCRCSQGGTRAEFNKKIKQNKPSLNWRSYKFSVFKTNDLVSCKRSCSFL